MQNLCTDKGKRQHLEASQDKQRGNGHQANVEEKEPRANNHILIMRPINFPKKKKNNTQVI
jgi:hypothetical protein